MNEDDQRTSYACMKRAKYIIIIQESQSVDHGITNKNSFFNKIVSCNLLIDDKFQYIYEANNVEFM